jgi:hypothetical protein
MEAAVLKRGISYLTNNEGRQTAIVFDLANESVQELMEDLFDTLTVVERRGEPTIPLSEVRADIKARLEGQKSG